MYIDIHTHATVAEKNNTLSIINLYDHFERADKGIICSVGLHPWYLNDIDNQLAQLKNAAALPNVLAIGECGLDKICNAPWNEQLHAFEQQIILAGELKKPLIVHCVRAYGELLETFKTYTPRVPVIIHGFNRKPTIAEKLLTEGHYLSFGAAILNDRSPAAEVLGLIPANRFFLESDDRPEVIADVYQKAAQIRKTNVEAIILQAEQNYKTVFRQ